MPLISIFLLLTLHDTSRMEGLVGDTARTVLAVKAREKGLAIYE